MNIQQTMLHPGIFWMMFIMLQLLSTRVVFAQWIQVNGPSGGTVNSFAICGGRLFAGLSQSGVFVFDKISKKWSPTSNDLASYNLRVLIAVGDTLFAGTERGGVFLSSDYGSTWTARNDGFIEHHVLNLGAAGGTLLASTNNSRECNMWYSTDHAITWKLLSYDCGAVRSFASIGSSLFAATEHQLYLLHEGGFPGEWLSPSMTALCVDGNALYGASADGDVWASTNYGQSWIHKGGGFSPSPISSLLAKEDVLYAGTMENGLYRSTDSGSTWSVLNAGIANLWITAMVRFDSSVYFGTYGGGIRLVSDSRDDWSDVSTGLPPALALRVYVDGSELFAGTWGGGLFASSDEGSTWISRNAGLGTSRVIDVLVLDSIMLAAGTVGVFRSTDRGRNWVVADSGIKADRIKRFCATEDGVYALSDGRWFAYSSDVGRTWTHTTGKFPSRLSYYGLVSACGMLFATGQGGIQRSSDRGSTWLLSDNGIEDLGICVAAVNDVVFAGTDNAGVYRSTDCGESWQPVGFGLHERIIQTLAFYDGTLYAGVYQDGVYVLPPRASNWTKWSEGFTADWIGSYAFSGSTVYAATEKGVWKRSLHEMPTSVANRETGECTFSMGQNYPNPFNTSTQIALHLNNAGYTRLTIFDMVGRQKTVLHAGWLNAGGHILSFGADTLPPGMYVCRLEVDGQALTRVITVLK